ncbi:MAG: hypothetical protein ABSA57_08485 [Candidatus Acidiferrales bacterium]|jgi:hypothetical protein
MDLIVGPDALSVNAASVGLTHLNYHRESLGDLLHNLVDAAEALPLHGNVIG